MEENDAKYDPRIRRAKLKPHKDSSFQKIIAVVSGKGGVGKSFVTSLLAVSLMNEGHKVRSWMLILQVLPSRKPLVKTITPAWAIKKEFFQLKPLVD